LESLANLIDDGEINSKQGKEIFAEMFATGKTPEAIVEEKGIKQESNLGVIEAICQQVIDTNPVSVEDYKAGKSAAINFLKGQVMKLSKGKANPNLVGEVLVKLLN
jgi:aspartyl-tRNA(Asn)/glutamyl-tRNA(Gln) amidotransferase subunit B